MGSEKPLLVIVITGLPLTGKSTIAKAVSVRLGIRYLDIDVNIRHPVFGLPHPNSYTDPVLKGRGRAEMGQSYDLLMHAVDSHLILDRSVIATATFSRELARKNLRAVIERHPEAQLRVIWCHTRRADVELAEIERRLTDRKFGVDYFGGCNSVEHYLDDRARYPEMDLPHLELDTFPPHTVEECVARALEYIGPA